MSNFDDVPLRADQQAEYAVLIREILAAAWGMTHPVDQDEQSVEEGYITLQRDTPRSYREAREGLARVLRFALAKLGKAT